MTKRKVEHSLGKTIRGLREEDLGMSQAQLAADAELGQGYLSQIENDEVLSLGAAVLFRLAAALAVDPKVIMKAAGYATFLEQQGEEIHFGIDPNLAAFIGKLTSRVQVALFYLLASVMGKPLPTTIETKPNTDTGTKNRAVKRRKKQKLGDVIRTLREAIPLTQGMLSKNAVLSQGYLSQLESGDIKNPSAIMLLRIAKALKVDPNVLFEAAEYLTAKRQQELYQANEEGIHPDLATFLSELSKPQQRRLLLLLRAIESLLGSKKAKKTFALTR